MLSIIEEVGPLPSILHLAGQQS